MVGTFTVHAFVSFNLGIIILFSEEVEDVQEKSSKYKGPVTPEVLVSNILKRYPSAVTGKVPVTLTKIGADKVVAAGNAGTVALKFKVL